LAVSIAFRSTIQTVAVVTSENESLVNAGSERTLAFIPYVLTSVKEWVFYYSWRLFVPVRLSLDPDSKPITHLTPAVLFAAGVIVALMLFAVYLRQRDRLMAAAFALIVISPISAYCVFPLADIVAEHRAYITVAGAVILLAILAARIPKPALAVPLVLA